MNHNQLSADDAGAVNDHGLYNKSNYSHILIGSYLWSNGGQTHR